MRSHRNGQRCIFHHARWTLNFFGFFFPIIDSSVFFFVSFLFAVPFPASPPANPPQYSSFLLPPPICPTALSSLKRKSCLSCWQMCSNTHSVKFRRLPTSDEFAKVLCVRRAAAIKLSIQRCKFFNYICLLLGLPSRLFCTRFDSFYTRMLYRSVTELLVGCVVLWYCFFYFLKDISTVNVFFFFKAW